MFDFIKIYSYEHLDLFKFWKKYQKYTKIAQIK